MLILTLPLILPRLAAAQAPPRFGPTGPVDLVALGSAGEWAAWCEQGAVRITASSGWTQQVDRLQAMDHSTRWLVVVVGTNLLLLDTRGGRTERLAQYPDPALAQRGDLASFDLQSRLLFVRGDDRLVLRTWHGRSSEDRLLPASGPARIAPNGEWVWVWPEGHDTRPREVTPLPPANCTEPYRPFGPFDFRRPDPAPHLPGAAVWSLGSPEQRSDAEHVLGWMSGGLVAQADREVVWSRGDAVQVLADAACGAQLWAIGRDSVYVQCEDGISHRVGLSDKEPLQLPGHAQTSTTGFEDRWLTDAQFVLDTDRGVVHRAPDGWLVQRQFEGNLLLAESTYEFPTIAQSPGRVRWEGRGGARVLDGHFWVDQAVFAKRWAVLPRMPSDPSGEPYAVDRGGTPLLPLTDWVLLDLATGTSRAVHGQVAAVTESGRILFFAGPNATGPLSWE